MAFDIPKELAQKIEAIAEQEQRDVVDVLQAMVADYRPKPAPNPEPRYDENGEEIPPDGTGARLAYEARKANIYVGEKHKASDADDILRAEFADYLLRKTKDNNASE